MTKEKTITNVLGIDDSHIDPIAKELIGKITKRDFENPANALEYVIDYPDLSISERVFLGFAVGRMS